MGLYAKVTAHLNASRQEALAEMLREEPLATPGSLASLAIDVTHREWQRSGRDIKALLCRDSARSPRSQQSPQSGEKRPCGKCGTPASVPGRVA